MTGFDGSALYQRMGEMLARMDGQDRTLEEIKVKSDRNFHETQDGRQALALLGQRVESLQADHSRLDLKLTTVATRVSEFTAAAGLARGLLNWGPLSAGAIAFLMLIKDWLIAKLGP